nr:IclR family transcriptional regulator [Pseudarthrobacter albicanus]
MSGMNLKSAVVPPDGAAQKLPAQAQSQTLSRGIRVLELLSDTQSPMTIAEISERSGLHRSIAYRILRTLEDHSLVARDDSGKFQCGPGLAALARGVARDLQSAALPVLTALAGHLQMTAFIAVWDQRQCVTLVAVEPPHGEGTLVQRPGTRHSFSAGAPGIAIQSALTEAEWETLAPGQPYREESRAAALRGYALSRDEVIPGVSSVGAPIRVPGQLPAALAVVYLRSGLSGDEVGARVRKAAAAIEDALH